MGKYQPLISIVVPTKNRYFYLKKLIVLVSKFEHIGQIEFVVQDNSDDNTDFLNFLSENNFSFLKYFHTVGPIPISKNSDFAIRNSTGEYVSFIGDDDGVTKYIVECCQWMKKNEVECLVPTGCNYYWPDAISASQLLESGGRLVINKLDNIITIKQTASAIKKLQACGCTHRDFLPLVYHGVVKRSTLDMIWEKCGTYFPGASPDIANGVALCFVMEKFACVNFPVVYSGASKHLGGDVNKFKHRAVTDFKELPFLPDNIDEIWNKRVPKIWTGPTIWCESSIEAMTAMGREDLIEGIDYEKLYENFVTFFYYYRSMAYSLTKNKICLFVKSSAKILVRLWNIIIRIVNNKILKNRYRKGSYVESDVVDIISANRCLEQEIASSHVNPFA